MIAIIDYDAGNLGSVQKALHFIGEECIVTRSAQIILSADRIILPGVGAYGVAMRRLQKYALLPVIKEAAASGIPLLGICLGMQLLFQGSEENGGIEGLGLLPGQIIRFPDQMGLKIPHIGWNSLSFPRKGRLFAADYESAHEAFVYFVHSYYLKAQESAIVTAVSTYGVQIHAAVEQGNLFGCQFHPEKSSDYGLAILKNFAGAAFGG